LAAASAANRSWGLGLPTGRIVAVVALVAGLCVGLVRGAGAEPVRFVDVRGNAFAVDPATGQFAFSSPKLPVAIAGVSRVVQVGQRFTLVQSASVYTIYASVDMSHQVVTLSVLRTKDRRLVLSVQNATTSLPVTPTATPTPAPDAWRVAGNGALASRSPRLFAVDVFRNPGQPARGTFTYRDPARRLVLSARRIDALTIEDGVAKVTGVYTQDGVGDGEFTLQFRPLADGSTLMSLALAGGYRVDGPVTAGRVRISARKVPEPSPTPTRTATRMPQYTPTTTPTPLPTTTPLPTLTPTPPLPTVPPR
jgi:hypothetical protein